MEKHSIEKYQNFEIEWIVIPSFELYRCGHGVELQYRYNRQKKLVGFVEGYEWYHEKKGPCKIYILSQDSKEWSDLITESDRILNDTRESAYNVLQHGRLSGRIEGNIYAHANA